jgi:hypothetical protein
MKGKKIVSDSQKQIMVATVRLASPRIYLRGEVSEKRIKNLHEVWKVAQADVKKGQPPNWPFTALDVIAIAKPTKEQKEQDVTYEIVDGEHRHQLALRVPIVYVPAVIHENLNERDMVLLQWERTVKSALGYSHKQRDEAVRVLAKITKMTQVDLSYRIGLSTATVSRILKAEEKAPHGGARAWSDSSWFIRAHKLAMEYGEHYESINKYMTGSFPVETATSPTFEQIINAYYTMINRFSEVSTEPDKASSGE